MSVCDNDGLISTPCSDFSCKTFHELTVCRLQATVILADFLLLFNINLG